MFNLFQAGKKVQYVLGEYPCHNFLGDSQYFTLSELGELRNEYMCATASTDYGKVDSYFSKTCKCNASAHCGIDDRFQTRSDVKMVPTATMSGVRHN